MLVESKIATVMNELKNLYIGKKIFVSVEPTNDDATIYFWVEGAEQYAETTIEYLKDSKITFQDQIQYLCSQFDQKTKSVFSRFQMDEDSIEELFEEVIHEIQLDLPNFIEYEFMFNEHINYIEFRVYSFGQRTPQRKEELYFDPKAFEWYVKRYISIDGEIIGTKLIIVDKKQLLKILCENVS